MNATTNAAARNNGTRYQWMGFAMGLVCMAALFIAGLVKGNAGMVVMASSAAAALAAAWSASATFAKKKAAAGS
ncbi:hypothetical protein [Arthrobacter sp. TWP1-1]|uniref:hypothetical protein n=1 Tax=Arthrobacter sp. TWP1-1 TaxID=2804568 RepID=UPI003CF416C7